ncbi:MAG TPA: ATP-binding protein [Steroidobacteraceae bacterium]|nr:ATP-binding protein [Steroidobacteraceae bacterium]
MGSVSRRLLISVTVLLLLFFGVMAAVLDARFRDVAQNSLHELLDAQMVALIASADQDAKGQVVPRLSEDAESRLTTPGSGLYAAVSEGGGDPYWRSPSAAGSLEQFGPPQEPGARDFRYLMDSRGAQLAVVSRGVQWEDAGDLTFSVATDLAPYDAQVTDFRRGLVKGFAALAVSLLLALALLLRWALAPLRRLAVQIRAVERGERESLDDRWPVELGGVVANLNTLLTSERTRISRYRDTLGNLAHSLKTPLAVLRASFGGSTPGSEQVNAQVNRMTAIVEHQLRRAATSGGASVGRHSVEVLPIATDLRAAMLKAHGKKDFSLELAVPPDVLFVGDRDDLLEALGNLMDNAAKWCRSQVRVAAQLQAGVGAGQKLWVVVEDDGPGVPAADRERVQERGIRADEATPGHGLGLAMVRDMAEMYGGQLNIGESRFGGARVELRLPGRLR